MRTIDTISNETVGLENGYYHGLYVSLQLNIYNGINRKKEQTEMGADLDGQDMEDVALDDEMECHQTLVLKWNEGGRDDEKALIYAKRWNI